MPGLVQGTLLLLLLAAVGRECAGASRRARCTPEAQMPCVDTAVLQNLTQRVSKGIERSDDENILLKKSTFDKISKGKKVKVAFLHGCVLYKIVDFYERVLKQKLNLWHNQPGPDLADHENLLFLMMRLKLCIRWRKAKCEELYREAEETPLKEDIPESKMKPKDVAILQLQKLRLASEKLDDMKTQERAMDEMQVLHHYIPGRGLRKQAPTGTA